MFQKKYLIIIGIVICLLVVYYLHDEISNLKKTFTPIYKKTMALEAKINSMEKRSSSYTTEKSDDNNSTIYSMSYQTEHIKNPNVSIEYDNAMYTDAKIRQSVSEKSSSSNSVRPRLTKVFKKTKSPNHDKKPSIENVRISSHQKDDTNSTTHSQLSDILEQVIENTAFLDFEEDILKDIGSSELFSQLSDSKYGTLESPSRKHQQGKNSIKSSEKSPANNSRSRYSTEK